MTFTHNEMQLFATTFALVGIAILALKQSRDLARERKRTKNWQTAAETAGLGVWEYDPGTGFAHCEHSMFGLLGQPVVGNSDALSCWAQNIVPEDSVAFGTYLKTSSAHDQPQEAYFRVLAKDRTLTIRVLSRRILDRRGQLRVVGVVQDISQTIADRQRLKELDLDLNQRRIEAEVASRSKTQFLANISHEIRTPMNAVLGLLTLLQQTGLDARQAHFVETAQTSGRVLHDLLNDILDVTKAEAGKIVLEQSPFSLANILDELLVMTGTLAVNKTVKVLLDAPHPLPGILIGDSLRLHQVLINLAGNAIKFTEKGHILVGVYVQEMDNVHATIRFSVVDSGIGIAPELVESVFQGFTQAEASTTRRFGGTGLGLSICRSLVELMGGHLEVQTKVGKGSEFSFTVTWPRTRTGNPEAKGFQRPNRVLIIEEDPLARTIMSGWFRAWHSTVETVGDLSTGWKLFSEGQSFDAVIVNAELPATPLRQVVEVLRQIGKSSPRPQIVVLTGLKTSWPIEGPRLSELDAVTTLVKPVTPWGLIQALSERNLVRSVEFSPLIPNPRLLGHRTLLVEDNPINQLVAHELLLKEGAIVTLADGGQAALERLDEQEFDSILMDVQMPDMDGYQTAREIRHRWGSAPFIVAVTANVSSRDRKSCLLAGMDGHVGKPLDIDHLVRVLNRGKSTKDEHQVVTVAVDFDVETALNRLGNDQSLFDRVVRQFLVDSDPLWKQISNDRSDRTTLKRDLHTLKGLAATVGALALSQEAKRLEDAIDNGHCEPEEAAQGQLEERLNAAHKYFKELRRLNDV